MHHTQSPKSRSHPPAAHFLPTPPARSCPSRYAGLHGATPAAEKPGAAQHQQQEHPWATTPSLCQVPRGAGGVSDARAAGGPWDGRGRCHGIHNHGQTSHPCLATWGGSSGHLPHHPWALSQLNPQKQYKSKLKVSFACGPAPRHLERLSKGAESLPASAHNL